MDDPAESAARERGAAWAHDAGVAGVTGDEAAIRRMLALTPTERLAGLTAASSFFGEARRA